ncbi:hypothetical protein [Acidianus sp. RZ1]|uniref:hypothetical protein n=1 Tax=Acidianus sp. RZ1 TaxID=1540082 RepID=UPI001492181F|nr:hypothetical protein [Acidianus sp. RZ1]
MLKDIVFPLVLIVLVLSLIFASYISSYMIRPRINISALLSLDYVIVKIKVNISSILNDYLKVFVVSFKVLNYSTKENICIVDFSGTKTYSFYVKLPQTVLEKIESQIPASETFQISIIEVIHSSVGTEVVKTLQVHGELKDS